VIMIADPAAMAAYPERVERLALAGADLVPAGSLDAAVRALLDDPAQARRMGAAGRERAVREFSYDVLAHRLGVALGALPD